MLADFFASARQLGPGHGAGSFVELSQTFDTPEVGNLKEAWVVFAADDAATVFLNGTEIGTAQQGSNPDFTARYGTFALPLDLLKEKDNVLAVRLTNTPQTPAGLIGNITLIPNDGSPRFLPMDATWKWVEGEPAPGWMDAGFDDSSWPFAIAVQPNGQMIGLAGYAPPPRMRIFRISSCRGRKNGWP